MTETEKKALALVNELFRPLDDQYHTLDDAGFDEVCEALLHAIEQHEAFRQEVSEAVKSLLAMPRCDPDEVDLVAERLGHLIIPKTDPLEKALEEAGYAVFPADLKRVRAAIEARGGRIVWEGE